MVEDRKEIYMLWLRMGRGICSMVKDRKEIYIPWLRMGRGICSNGGG